MDASKRIARLGLLAAGAGLTAAALAAGAAALAVTSEEGHPPAAVSGTTVEGRPPADDPPIDMRYAQVEKVQFVLVSATVTDSKGRLVPGLTMKDFRLTEQGMPVAIEMVATESNAPIAIAFVLDLSGSMRHGGRLEVSKQAILTFVQALGAKDRFGLIGFADNQVRWITDFTSDALAFRRRLEVQEGLGQTALYDALAASPGLVAEGVQARRAIVLLTDGLDNASALDPLKAVQTARRVSVPIYAINYTLVPAEMLSEESRQGLLLIERFSRETGGRSFSVSKPEELREAMQVIQADLRLQYVIGFQPRPKEAPERFRSIRLETTKRRLNVRCRSGYYPDS